MKFSRLHRPTFRRPLILDYIESALQSLKLGRTRSLLTILGITIGTACITSIMSLSHGVGSLFTQQATAVGDTTIVVRPQLPPQSIENAIVGQQFNTSTITDADYKAIKDTPGITKSAPVVRLHNQLTNGDKRVTPGVIVATTRDFADLHSLTLRDGEFLPAGGNEYTAVIGPQLAVDLFGTANPLGMSFKLKDQSYIVIGVLDSQDLASNINGINYDTAAFIHYALAPSVTPMPQIQQVIVAANSRGAVSTVKTAITKQLTATHAGDQDVAVLSGSAITQPITQQFAQITSVMVAIATVSMIVGGIGIMNIMLVSVAERTREIGLRKAVGASNRVIIHQFLTESSLLSIIGGVIGIIMGYIVAAIIGQFIGFAPTLSPMIFCVTLGLSVATGLAFGLYPAVRAGFKNPIDSLRNYH